MNAIELNFLFVYCEKCLHFAHYKYYVRAFLTLSMASPACHNPGQSNCNMPGSFNPMQPFQPLNIITKWPQVALHVLLDIFTKYFSLDYI